MVLAVLITFTDGSRKQVERIAVAAGVGQVEFERPAQLRKGFLLLLSALGAYLALLEHSGAALKEHCPRQVLRGPSCVSRTTWSAGSRQLQGLGVHRTLQIIRYWGSTATHR